jgi:hypothetical protein
MHLKTVGADMSEGEETVEATDLDGAAETAETLEPKPPAPEGGEVVAFDKFRKK